MIPLGFSGFFLISFLSIFDAVAGTNVRAIIRLATSAYPRVSAISTKSVLVRPSTNTIGRNTHIVVSVDAVIAPATCTAPDIAAFATDSPLLLSLYIFSITTIELSTSIPTAIESPESDIIFKLIPEKYIRTTANITLTGILQSVMNVGLISLRNINRTITANNAPHRRLDVIESTTRLI